MTHFPDSTTCLLSIVVGVQMIAATTLCWLTVVLFFTTAMRVAPSSVKRLMSCRYTISVGLTVAWAALLFATLAVIVSGSMLGSFLWVASGAHGHVWSIVAPGAILSVCELAGLAAFCSPVAPNKNHPLFVRGVGR